MSAYQADTATYAISQKQVEKGPVSAAAATRRNRVPFWPRSGASVKGFVGILRHWYRFATRSQLNAVLAQKPSCEKQPFMLHCIRKSDRLSGPVSSLTLQSRSRSWVAFFGRVGYTAFGSGVSTEIFRFWSAHRRRTPYTAFGSGVSTEIRICNDVCRSASLGTQPSAQG